MERKFAVPGIASLLALANDVGSLGIDFKTLVLIACLSLGYAALETWKDIRFGKPYVNPSSNRPEVQGTERYLHTPDPPTA